LEIEKITFLALLSLAASAKIASAATDASLLLEKRKTVGFCY